MKRHVVCTVVSGILLSACLGGSAAWGQDKQGTPRPSYPSGFAPGTRVTLLEDAPAVAEGFQAGRSGTVIGCDSADCSRSILVSWDLYSGGQDEGADCVAGPVGLYPPGSTSWVNPAEVKLGLPFDKAGILQEEPDGCLYLPTDEGVFYLVMGREYRNQWWVVRPGNRVRVRGLLNRSPVDPTVERACPQADGDVYHPILASADWYSGYCCDRWVCGFSDGDRVVLISEENPNGAVDLPRGSTGTIICCKGEGDNAILVSWDLWANGGSDDAYVECLERLNGLFPPGSSWWVSAKDIAKVSISPSGILQPMELCVGAECLDRNAVALVTRASYIYYLSGIELVPPPSGRFQAVGLVTPYGKLLSGQVVVSDTVLRQDLAGIFLAPILVLCPEPSCCQPPYAQGDQVTLLVDEPGGAKGLMAGASGRVRCCNASDSVTPIFVSWDDWTGGNNDQEACDQWPGWYPDHSGWWMACSEISLQK
jgi:hypothetical protein